MPAHTHAADIDLHIAPNGDVLNNTTIVGEAHHGWRRDIIFTSLGGVAGAAQFTVGITGNNNIDLINPNVYAIHGGESQLLSKTASERIWLVSAPPGSSVTIVAEVPAGILQSGLGWKLLADATALPDNMWIGIAILAPLLFIIVELIRQRRREAISTDSPLDPELLRASPAALTVLWRGFVSRRATAATLLDLARRGHVQILVRNDTLLLYRRESDEPLREHERKLLDRWFGLHWDSKIHVLAHQNKRELINEQSISINVAIYDEINHYGWFDPPPMFSHWRVLILCFVMTLLFSVLFFTIFIFIPSATPLLWFLTSWLVCVGLLYTWIPLFVSYTVSGHRALAMMVTTKLHLSANTAIHAAPANATAWEYWLPLAMVLGVAHQWLTRWSNAPFQQPGWLLTDEPIRDFNQFLTILTPVLNIASESIRDKILPAYL